MTLLSFDTASEISGNGVVKYKDRITFPFLKSKFSYNSITDIPIDVFLTTWGLVFVDSSNVIVTPYSVISFTSFHGGFVAGDKIVIFVDRNKYFIFDKTSYQEFYLPYDVAFVRGFNNFTFIFSFYSGDNLIVSLEPITSFFSDERFSFVSTSTFPKFFVSDILVYDSNILITSDNLNFLLKVDLTDFVVLRLLKTSNNKDLFFESIDGFSKFLPGKSFFRQFSSGMFVFRDFVNEAFVFTNDFDVLLIGKSIYFFSHNILYDVISNYFYNFSIQPLDNPIQDDLNFFVYFKYTFPSPVKVLGINLNYDLYLPNKDFYITLDTSYKGFTRSFKLKFDKYLQTYKVNLVCDSLTLFSNVVGGFVKGGILLGS